MAGGLVPTTLILELGVDGEPVCLNSSEAGIGELLTAIGVGQRTADRRVPRAARGPVETLMVISSPAPTGSVGFGSVPMT